LLPSRCVVAGLLVITWRLARRELTERRHTERVLRESESVFRQLSENVREVFYLCEWPTGGLIFVSPAFARVWGRPIGGAFSFRRQWIDDVDPRDRALVREQWETSCRARRVRRRVPDRAATARSAGSTTARSRCSTQRVASCGSPGSPRTSPTAHAASCARAT
jgi:PAS domain-containing protein